MSSDATTLGPVEMLMIGFPDDRFDGSIVPALAELVDTGTIRILDLVVLRKDLEGNVAAVEVSELDPDEAGPLDDLDGEVGELFSDEDLLTAGDELEPGSAAALVLWENSWAANLAAAVRGNGGEVLVHDRIPAEVVAEALAAQDDLARA